eukprot:347682-Chlamydomonas_euryale.AAC.1
MAVHCPGRRAGLAQAFLTPASPPPPLLHRSSAQQCAAQGGGEVMRKRLKRITEEISTLSTSLPLRCGCIGLLLRAPVACAVTLRGGGGPMAIVAPWRAGVSGRPCTWCERQTMYLV